MNERRIETWAELQEVLFEESWKEEIGRFRSNLAFRGRNDAADDLRTSLTRLGGDLPAQEGHLVRNFRKYAVAGAAEQDSLWNWLALGQHHGLPTRMLDWTYSPYVALHFTTADRKQFDRDGAVWTLDYVQAHELAPAPLREALDREGANVFTTEMLADAAPRLGDLARLGENFVVFVEPPSFDARIVNQFALFSLMSRPGASLDAWSNEHPELVRKIVIPAGLKWEVRDKLDQANVTERVLFPGLDGLSRWLARQYVPRVT